jgi:hypothetical protein
MTEKIFRKFKDGDTQSDNLWFNHCSRKQIPYVTLRYRTSLADVEWDYISFNHDVDPILERNKDGIQKGALSIFEKYANERSEYSINNHVIFFKKLRIDSAEKAATELYGLISSFLPSSQDCVTP